MEILILDIETTGFLQQGGKIVEVGIVALNLTDGSKRIVFDSVCHERPITRQEVEDSWIVQNSTLSVESIRSSPKFEDLKPTIQAIINSYHLGCTAYNNAFDFGFLESRGVVFPRKLACPMLVSTNVAKIPGTRGYKWPKVQEMWDFIFGKQTGYIEEHRGADDAMHEADIVYWLYKNGHFTI